MFLRFDWAKNTVLRLPIPAAHTQSLVDHPMSLEESVRVLADHESTARLSSDKEDETTYFEQRSTFLFAQLGQLFRAARPARRAREFVDTRSGFAGDVRARHLISSTTSAVRRHRRVVVFVAAGCDVAVEVLIVEVAENRVGSVEVLDIDVFCRRTR